MRTLVLAIAAAETATGVVALASPNLVARLLFGGEVAGAGEAFGRFAGVALVGLGVGSLGASRDAVRGLLVYSALATVGLALMGWTGVARGPLLWPAAALHLGVTILLARAFFGSQRPSTPRGETH